MKLNKQLFKSIVKECLVEILSERFWYKCLSSKCCAEAELIDHHLVSSITEDTRIVNRELQIAYGRIQHGVVQH